MTAFRDREYDILVSTSVIEVGIDVPNATVMLIEGADRFGLAQLHQFRGRVGRGAAQRWCLLLADEATPEGEARWQMMVATDDGFALAEKDLELRGPGDFIGTRQSGLPEMSWLDGSFDPRVLDRARRAAEAILNHDPELALPEHSRAGGASRRVLGKGVAGYSFVLALQPSANRCIPSLVAECRRRSRWDRGTRRRGGGRWRHLDQG